MWEKLNYTHVGCWQGSTKDRPHSSQNHNHVGAHLCLGYLRPLVLSPCWRVLNLAPLPPHFAVLGRSLHPSAQILRAQKQFSMNLSR